jgi:hypothetical protein
MVLAPVVFVLAFHSERRPLAIRMHNLISHLRRRTARCAATGHVKVVPLLPVLLGLTPYQKYRTPRNGGLLPDGGK